MGEQATAGGALLTKDEAVAYLGGYPITLKTIEGLVRRRELAHVKIGRATRFTQAALDAYVAAHTVQVSENKWGLSDRALANLRADRPERKRRSA